MAKSAKPQGIAPLKLLLGQSLGYNPTIRMKLVHFATSFLLALEQRHRELRWLNIAANPKFLEKGPNDPYVASNLFRELSTPECGVIGPAVNIDSLMALREHLNAAYNNDGAALSAAFAPHKTFGGDYSAPSPRYLTNQSKSHGGSGFFVWAVLNRSALGQDILRKCRVIARAAAPTAHDLGLPLVDAQEEVLEQNPEELCGNPAPERLREVSVLMEPQTAALGLLVDHLATNPTVYSLRQMMIGVGSWLLSYEMRCVPGFTDSVIFCDFCGECNPRVRSQAAACYSRRLGAFGRSVSEWLERSPDGGEGVDTELLRGAVEHVGKECEEHFREFSGRVGWVQPRSGSAVKYFRPQPDTLRVLLTSVLRADEWCTMDEVAGRLRESWHLVFGLLPGDHSELRRHGFSPLDEDFDLRANREAFKRQAIRLGLAWEPSDGLVLFRLASDTSNQVV